MDDMESTAEAGSVVGALLATAFVALLVVALMDPTGTTASAGIGAADPSHFRPLGCGGDSVPTGSTAGANAALCTR